MKTIKHLIGILGPSGGGKSTLTKNVMASDPSIGIVSFADHLKEEAKRRGWSGLKDDEGRRFLQVVSENMKKEFGESVFYDVGQAKAMALDKSIVLYDDCRFLIEIANLKKHHTEFIGSVIVFEEPTAEEVWYRASMSTDSKDAWAQHRSETEWRSVRSQLRREQISFHNDKSLGIALGSSKFHAYLTKHIHEMEKKYV